MHERELRNSLAIPFSFPVVAIEPSEQTEPSDYNAD
jgi:hypothetical protein